MWEQSKRTLQMLNFWTWQQSHSQFISFTSEKVLEGSRCTTNHKWIPAHIGTGGVYISHYMAKTWQVMRKWPCTTPPNSSFIETDRFLCNQSMTWSRWYDPDSHAVENKSQGEVVNNFSSWSIWEDYLLSTYRCPCPIFSCSTHTR